MMTVYYNGKLKRTRTPEEVFAKIRSCVKPKGVTKRWTIEEGENYLIIDFCDDRSENLSFNFNNKSIVGSCKINFDGDESEKAIKHGEKQLETFFNLFHSIIKMFSTLEISDEFGLWNDFVDSKRYKIQIRELTENENERIKKLYGSGCVSHEDIVRAVIAEDLNITSICDIDYSFNSYYTDEYKHPYVEEQKIIEAWLVQTAAYKDRGRIVQYKVKCYGGYRWKEDDNEVSELEFAVFACINGISELFFGKLDELYPARLPFGQKDAQVKRLFKDKFLPLFNTESEAYKQCILAYRYMVSVYDYCGFKFAGKE